MNATAAYLSPLSTILDPQWYKKSGFRSFKVGFEPSWLLWLLFFYHAGMSKWITNAHKCLSLGH